MFASRAPADIMPATASKLIVTVLVLCAPIPAQTATVTALTRTPPLRRAPKMTTHVLVETAKNTEVGCACSKTRWLRAWPSQGSVKMKPLHPWCRGSTTRGLLGTVVACERQQQHDVNPQQASKSTRVLIVMQLPQSQPNPSHPITCRNSEAAAATPRV